MDPAERERRLWELLAARELDAFAALLHDGGLFIDGAQLQTKSELMDGLRDVTLTAFAMRDVAVNTLADNACTVVYAVTETVVASSGELTRTVLASSTWISSDDRWLLALHHESAVD